MRTVQIFLVVALLLPIAACGQSAPAPVVAPTTLDALEAYIAQARQDWQVPGLAVAIVKDGEVVLSRGYGELELGGEQAVDAQTLFAIASNTKAFTAAALAILVDEGKLKWDDRVRDHLPYFELYDPFVSSEMRVRDLLCHRSGLGTFSGDLLWYGTRYSTEEVVRRARHCEPAGGFRASYGYSNLMYLAAGEVVAATSGMPWSEFVRQRILEPVGMDRTVLTVADLPSLTNVATPHKTRTDNVVPIDWFNWDAMGPAGGIISCSDDMAKWLIVWLSEAEADESTPLFSETQRDQMWSAHTTVPRSKSARQQYPSNHFSAYGLGWTLRDYQGHLLVGHGGGYDGMFSRVVLVPEQQLGIAVLTNSMTPISTAITNRIVDHYLGVAERDWSAELLESFQKDQKAFEDRIAQHITPAVQESSPSKSLDAYVGSYVDPMYGEVEVSLDDDQLVLKLLPAELLVADLTHLHFDTFVIHWRHEFAWFDEGTATFVLDEAGRVAKLQLNVPNDDLWFHELHLRRHK